MGHKLFIFFLVVFNYAHSQQFSLENLQTNEQIEVALDSAYHWMEIGDLKSFTDCYFIIEKAIDLKRNEEFEARFNAYKAGFFCYLRDNDKFDLYLSPALQYYERVGNVEMLSYVYNLKGIYESDVKRNDKESLSWYKKALDLECLTDDKSEKAVMDIYYNMTISGYRTNDWDTTYDASTNCIAFAQKYSTSRLRRMHSYKGIAMLYKNDIEGAIKSFEIAEDLVKEEEASRGEKVYYKDVLYLYGFSEVYRVLGDSEKSAAYLKMYNIRMSESVEKTLQTTGVRIKKHSDLLVDLARKKEELAKEELKKTALFYSTLITGSLVLFIVGLLYFVFQQRNNQIRNFEKNKLLLAKNKELNSVKEKVENTLKVKTDFLNSITHELRTPLFAIKSITQLMKENDGEKVEKSQIDILSFSGDHLLRFVNDVIDINLGAEDLQNQHLKLEYTDLGALLDKIKKTITFSLGKNNENNVVFDIDSAISKNLMIDSLKLSRVLINLLNNALKYTQKGAVLLIVRQLENTGTINTVEFCVKDNGEGISKEQLNEIYEAFNNNFNVVKRLNDRASGLGIGLVMVNRILKLYNSELIINSKEGIGTTMKFQINFDIVFNDIVMPTSKLGDTFNKKHILIVDDNKVNQMVTSKIIKDLGHTCDIAKGGEEAIVMFKENERYDFVLMDIMMPGIDGFQASEIIKSINPEQKILAMTAISIRENKLKFAKAGFDTVIEKPFKIEKFAALIA